MTSHGANRGTILALEPVPADTHGMEHTTTTTRLENDVRCSWCVNPAVTIHRSDTLLCTFHATLFIPRVRDVDGESRPQRLPSEDGRRP